MKFKPFENLLHFSASILDGDNSVLKVIARWSSNAVINTDNKRFLKVIAISLIRISTVDLQEVRATYLVTSQISQFVCGIIMSTFYLTRSSF